MSIQEKFLRARNRFSPEGETEIYGHYKKSAKGYFLRVFFGKFFFQLLAFTAIAVTLFLGVLFSWDESDVMFYIIGGFMVGLGPFCYIIHLIIGIWEWKYCKHVVVTNEGIWLAYCGHPFWQGKSFDGKRRFFSVDWMIYDWAELSGLFEEECAVSKLYKLKDIIMVRWDGEQPVRFLTLKDFDAIMEYGDKMIKPRKRKPRAKKPQMKWWERIFTREE